MIDQHISQRKAQVKVDAREATQYLDSSASELLSYVQSNNADDEISSDGHDEIYYLSVSDLVGPGADSVCEMVTPLERVARRRVKAANDHFDYPIQAMGRF